MWHDIRGSRPFAPGIALVFLSGVVLVGCAQPQPPPAAVPAAVDETSFTFAGPPFDCHANFQAQARKCVAVIVINNDMTYDTCACDMHEFPPGSGNKPHFDNNPLPPNWVMKGTPDNVTITKWVPPNYTGTDPCTTYIIAGVPQKVCW
jgi:hypothetical protein